MARRRRAGAGGDGGDGMREETFACLKIANSGLPGQRVVALVYSCGQTATSSCGSGRLIVIVGIAEENNVVFLWACGIVFMVNLESLQFKKLCETNFLSHYHPFESVYTSGNRMPFTYRLQQNHVHL
jgi:hypothetical protein